MDNDFRVSRLMRIYTRWGGVESSLVRPFQSWPEEVRLSLTSDANISTEESPFLAFYENSSKWTVLTLSRIIWKKGEQVHQIPFSDLRDADLSADAIAALSMAIKNATTEDDIAKISVEWKTHANRLLLLSTNGNKSLVEFEPGKTFFGFWNVVKMLIVQSHPTYADDG